MRQAACKPGSVHEPPYPCGRAARWAIIPLGHALLRASSNQPGRLGRNKPARSPARRPYSVLLPVGFALPRPLPAARCALTAPFHCSRGRDLRDLLSVALSLIPPKDFPWIESPDVIRHRRFVEPGLSSPGRSPPRSPGRLAKGQYRAARRPRHPLPQRASVSSGPWMNSRQSMNRMAMVAGPMNRPSRPNVSTPPRMPSSTQMKGSCVALPMSAGRMK